MPEQNTLFFLNNQNLFSNNYLEHRLPATALWKEQGEKASEVFDNIKKSYEAIKPLKLGPGEEAGLEDKFIRPVLKALGYEFDVQPRTQRGYKKKRPDYALFKDRASYEDARKEKDNPPRFYTHPLTILEAKYWGRRLNDTDKKDTLDVRDPTAQTVKYLDDVHHASEGRIQWAILTNGKEWRIFYYRAASRSGNFFEINLENIITENDREKFLYFYLFFSKDAFIPDLTTGKTWLDQHLDGSEAYAKVVSDRLKELIFDEVFEGLAEGFIHYRRNELSIQQETDENKKEIFKGCLTLLYRLLFLLYAESRNLLPVEENSYHRVSLKKLKQDIYRDLKTTEPDKMSKRSFVYFARLEGLFEIIAKGDPALNVPIYNGGLFENNPTIPPLEKGGKGGFLATHKMPDPYLAKAVKLLTVDHEDKYKPGSIPFIDYSSLNVRHLGDIYEGLLEFHIQIADEDMVEVKEGGRLLWKKLSEVKTGAKTNRKKTKGEIYIENSKHERKATGSYYTPHYIVEYIVKNTVGQTLEQRLKNAEALLTQLEKEIKASHRQQSASGIKSHRVKILEIEDAIFNTLFDIKVLDSAMGSGHFLVHTVDFISDRIIAFLAEYPENPVIKRIEGLKKEIIGEINRQGVRIDESKLTEVNLIKRMVMKRCIYGVDLNEMAVELAKLSLWLDSFTLGAPLSFLNHHLKCGNSLVGADLEAIENATKGQLFKINLEPLKRAIRDMLFVSSLSDATYEQVKNSASKYREADTSIEGYRMLLDTFVSEHFGIKEAKSFLLDKGTRIDLNNLKKSINSMPAKDKKVVEDIEKAAKEKQFFHWEIEFPEVFYERVGEHEQKVEKKENAGFDCVIGNPPYVNVENISKEDREYLLRSSKWAKGRFDIYISFTGKGYELLSNNGLFGFIIPYPFLYERYGELTRDILLQNGSPLQIVNLSEWKVFPDATVRNILLFFGKSGSPSEMAVLNQEEDPCLYGIKGSSNHIPTALLNKMPHKMFRLEINDVHSILKDKVDSRSIKLGQLCYINWGARSGNIKKYVVENGQANDAKPMLDGEDVRRYSIMSRGKFLLYRPKELYNPMFPELFESVKLIIPDVTGKNGVQASLDTNGFYTEHTVSLAVPKYFLKKAASRKIEISQEDEEFSKKYNLAFCLSIINSSLNRWYSASFIGGQLHTYPDDIKSFPIPRISFTTPEKERKERLEEFKRMYCKRLESLATNSDLCENKKHEEADDKKPSTESKKMAGKPQGYKLSAEGISGEGSGLGGKVHGVREGTGGYKPAEGTSQPIDSTRHFETSQGIKPYSEIAETIAVSVAKTIQEIIAGQPEKINITPEWICLLHKNIAGSLFDWAGRFRDLNVQVGAHTPPPFYEVPVAMRLYCDDLSARLSHTEKTKDAKETAELLAWADWRFQWIHPFRDFNGRVGRVLLTAILFKLKLPPAETASTEPKEKAEYLKALHLADAGDLTELVHIWLKRLSISAQEKED